VGGIGNYFAEGLKEWNDERIQLFFRDLMTAITTLTQDGKEGHVALKITTMISLDILQRLNRAQQVFLNDILKFDKQEAIDISDIRNSLLERGLDFSDQELTILLDSLKFEGNQSDKVSRLEVFANGHLFKLLSPQNENEEALNQILEKVALGIGYGVSENDLHLYRKFSDMVIQLTSYASERNCILYVDAEQTFIQD
jgi:hypothetical protein